MGIIVDTVSEVFDIQSDQIRSTPDFGSEIRTDFILGMCQIDERVIIILDIDEILSSSEICDINNITSRIDKPA